MSEFYEEKPITEEIARERRDQCRTIVLDCIKRVEEIANGFALSFESTYENVNLILAWIKCERICHPFLRIVITLESNEGQITVALSGPSGTNDFLKTELALQRWLSH